MSALRSCVVAIVLMLRKSSKRRSGEGEVRADLIAELRFRGDSASGLTRSKSQHVLLGQEPRKSGLLMAVGVRAY